MEKIINVIDFGGYLEKSKRNQLCLYCLKKENPDWKIKVWDENEEEVYRLISEPFYQNSLGHYSQKYEYLKLNLMLSHGGLWSECDQIFKASEFNEHFSYLQTYWDYQDFVSFNFCTWRPVYINNNDPKVRDKLKSAIQCLKDFHRLDIKFYEESCMPESTYQTALYVPKWLVNKYGIRIALDSIGETTIDENKDILSCRTHFAECHFQKNAEYYEFIHEHPLFDTALAAFLMSLPSDIDRNNYKQPNPRKVDYKLINALTYEGVRQFIS